MKLETEGKGEIGWSSLDRQGSEEEATQTSYVLDK